MKTLCAALVMTMALVACGDDTTGTGGSAAGGNAGTGGAASTGGNAGTGGAASTGGNAGTGGAAAGATCADFCADFFATCADFPDPTWADAAACETDCATWTQGTPGDTSGDTLECRAYHVGAAATDAATHCPHAASDGGGVCI